MPVQTRGAARRQAEVQSPPTIRSENTVITVSPSATRKGDHTRWLRPSNQPMVPEEDRDRSSDVGVDPRFKTPSPHDGSKLTTPPKIGRRPHHSNPVSSVETTYPRAQSEEPVAETGLCGRILYDEFRTAQQPISPMPANASQPAAQGLGSPFFSGRPSQSLQSFSQRSNDRLGVSHSSSLEDDSSDPQTESCHPQSTPSQTRGLGRHGTVLLGPDGRVVMHGIREDY